jgi:hypothetical protein
MPPCLTDAIASGTPRRPATNGGQADVPPGMEPVSKLGFPVPSGPAVQPAEA